MPSIVRNSAKPIKGVIAAVVAYLILKSGLDVDPDTSAGISAAVFSLVVRFVYPIFGSRVPTPEAR